MPLPGRPAGTGLREWLAFLARASARDVGLRLARADYLRESRGRGLRGGARWVPADPDCAFAAVIRARAALDVSRPCPAGQVVLAGLAGACGLGSRFLPYGPPDARSCLDAAIRGQSPDLRDVLIPELGVALRDDPPVLAAVMAERLPFGGGAGRCEQRGLPGPVPLGGVGQNRQLRQPVPGALVHLGRGFHLQLHLPGRLALADRVGNRPLNPGGILHGPFLDVEVEAPHPG